MRGSIAAGSIAVILAACTQADEPEPRATPAMVVAVDLDPDPDVVEVELFAEPGRVEYIAGVATEVLGYRDGGAPEGRVRVPGPLIQAEVGQRLIVHFHNRTDRSTTLHWHGLRLPVEMDGNPMVSGAVLPGADFDYEFQLLDAGTFWYHPHVDPDEQVELGLQGALLVLDPEDPPSMADRLFMLDDVDLDPLGQIDLGLDDADRMLGREGELLLVNGQAPASLAVPSGARERWRFINAANGRHFRLSLGARPLTVIGWDGGRIEEPYVVDALLIAPGERYEVSIDFDAEPGTRWQLDTLEVDRGEGRRDEGPRSLISIDIGAAQGLAKSPAPEAFARAIPISAIDASTPTRSFVLDETVDPQVGPLFTINGQRWPFDTPIEVELGALEIWEVENAASGPHPFHVHGLFFEVLDSAGVAPPTRGLKDTVIVPGQAKVRLALRYALPGAWMFHCTIFEHAEAGMMGSLLVSPP